MTNEEIKQQLEDPYGRFDEFDAANFSAPDKNTDPLRPAEENDTHTDLEAPQSLHFNLPKREGEPDKVTFKRVVIGHPYKRGFDRDQWIALAFARELNLINSHTVIEFSSNPDDGALKDPATLVLEGFNDARTDINTKKVSGNITNSDNGRTPAATTLLNLFRSEVDQIQDDEKRKRIRALGSWLAWAENGSTGTKPKDIDIFDESDLRSLTPIFYGLKSQHKSIDLAGNQLQESMQVIETILDPEKKGQLTSIYSEQIKENTRAEQNDLRQVNELLSTDPDRFRAYTLPNKWKIARIDIRGIDVEKGGTKAAEDLYKEKTQDSPDIIFLVADERNERDEVVGTKILLKTPRKGSKNIDTDLHSLLQDRLHKSEQLFGKGYEVTESTTFGGHEQVLSSPAWEGTGIDPEVFEAAFMEFGTSKRYSEKDFEKVINENLKEAGIQTRATPVLSTESRYKFPERTVEITLNSGMYGERVVTLNESDLELYMAVASETHHTFLELIETKYANNEHPEITQKREKKALEQFDHALENKNAVLALSALNKIPSATINTFSPNELLALVKLISTSEEAISEIWDPTNTRFEITADNIPDWVRKRAKDYNNAKYILKSLQSKIDTLIIDKLIDSRFSTDEDVSSAPQKLETIMALKKIIESESYQHQRSLDVPDNLFRSFARTALSETFEGYLQKLTLGALLKYNTPKFRPLWLDLAQSDPLSARKLITKSPEIAVLFEQYGINIDASDFKSQGIEVSNLTNEEIAADIRRQKETSSDAYITVLSSMGAQDTGEKVQQWGITKSDGTSQSNVQFGGIVSHDGFLNNIPLFTVEEEGILGDKIETTMTDLDLFVNETIQQLRTLITNPDFLKDQNLKFRVVIGRYVGDARDKLGVGLRNMLIELSKNSEITGSVNQEIIKKIPSRIILSTFTTDGSPFTDKPLEKSR